MKKLYAFFVCLVFTGLAIAQNDPAAKKVLDAVGAKVKISKGITANCSLASITSKGKSNGTQNATIQMKGEKYVIKQGKTEIICDGVNVYRFDGEKTITKTSVTRPPPSAKSAPAAA